MAAATVEGLAFPAEKKQYIINVLDPVLEELVQEILGTLPPDPLDFMVKWLRRRTGAVSPHKRSLKETNDAMKKDLHQMTEFVSGAAAAMKADNDEASEESEEEDDEDEGDLLPETFTKDVVKHRQQRQSVSAEAYGLWNKQADFTPPYYEKTAEQKERLTTTLSASFLFSGLQASDLDVILGAMEESIFEAGDRIITEGEDGEHLYVIEEGEPVCKKLIDGEQKVVKTCSPGDVFGELALLYNCPRAASVEALHRCVCWKLDRLTFNQVVKEAATKRSMQYDRFLKAVSLFSSMDSYERSQIVDVLKVETYKKGEYVMKQGEDGNRFYIVEEGTLSAMKKMEGEAEARNVLDYKMGDYFGELALLKNQPRAASILVTSDEAKVVWIDRKSFNRKLGHLQEHLSKRVLAYE